MKKLLSFLCLILLLAGCSRQQQQENPATADSPTEPTGDTVYVHSSITHTADQRTTRTDYCYDEENILTDVIICDAQGEELQRYQITCDENGNPIEWAANIDGAASCITYEYDRNGHILKTETYNNDLPVSSTSYTWSGDLRLSATVLSAALGYEQRTEYTYNDQGQLQRQDRYTDGVLTAYTVYTLDDNGRPATAQSYAPDGTAGERITYSYFEDKAEALVTTDAQGNVLQTQTLTYDDHGNLLSSILHDAAGMMVSSETHVWMAIQVPEGHPRAGI